MNCPCCRTELVPGDKRLYETLSEHVCDPNGEPGLRKTLVCLNRECAARQDDIFWDIYGEDYFGGDFRNPPWIDGNPHPFGSCFREEK